MGEGTEALAKEGAGCLRGVSLLIIGIVVLFVAGLIISQCS